ncbi:MAG: sulfite exporter TauE/SafE family protein [Rudaea sp.]|nr:sulfite exporter TauE/SafE family protein [Rudaea sp.]
MSGGLSLAGALLLGLLASGHCLLMCGGIAGALALATPLNANGRPRLDLLLGYQFGRIASYMLAGLSLTGVGAALVQFVDQDHVRLALRWMSAALFALIGLSLLGRGRGFDFGLGRHIWNRLAPIGRRLLPVRNLPQALAFGAVWGWMPCGLVYSVLFIAWLSMDPLRSAAIMLMFGLGTLPAVLAGTYGAGKSIGFIGRSGMRSSVAIALLLFAVLTAGGPWLAAHSGLHPHWLQFDCVSP